MNINNISDFLLNKYPLAQQEPWDSSGLLYNGNKDVKKVLVCLDITVDICYYALNENIDLIISHHPLIFRSYLDTPEYLRIIFQKLYRKNISILSLHTNYDNDDRGMNTYFVEKLGYQVLAKQEMLVTFLSDNDLLKVIKEQVQIPLRMYNQKEELHKAAVLLGAGGFSIEQTLNNNCDVLISSEFKHHEILQAKENGLMLIDVSHQAEKIFVEHLSNLLKEEYPQLDIIEYYDDYLITSH